MSVGWRLVRCVGLAFWAVSSAGGDDRIRHRIEIRLDPASHRMEVVDEITLPAEPVDGTVEFLLNRAFTVDDASPSVVGVPTGDVGGFFSLNSTPDLAADLELARYRLAAEPAGGVLTLSYSGVVDFGLSAQAEEYTRGFRETIGLIGEEGIYLGGSGFWYPFFGDELIEFELTAPVPAGWHLISQGSGTSRDASGTARWDSGGPVDEIYLVGGPMTAYREVAGAVEAQVYLRQADDALAARYLEATAQYLEMYRGLIGPYPYGKFALVENFWETGYGMPSFTLLGPRVIRFPFILTSSYPHEILHNWWGNSVFVDFSEGNWSEGLTAYLADHLIQEQRGRGEEYRRGVLQKYRSYVQSGEDFPLTEFRSRHSAATEAVGYGKTLMVFHMLRWRMGDEAFTRALGRFYRQYRGRRAAFSDLESVFEETAGIDLDRFFELWVERAGAPRFDLRIDSVEQVDGEFVVSGALTQTQGGEVYEMSVPAVVMTEEGAVSAILPVASRTEEIELRLAGRPLALRVDPRFDVFRLLDPLEIPPSIGQIFGAPRILAVLPENAGADKRQSYRALLESWQSDSHAIEIVGDEELEKLPADRSIWVVGRENRLASLFTDPEKGVLSVANDAIEVDGRRVVFSDHSLVVVRRHPEANEQAVGWLVVEPAAAFPGVGRKLPHYGKYSYLAFSGEEPTNVVKGQWPGDESPLAADLRPVSDRRRPLPAALPPPPPALAELPPAFSERRLLDHVRFLADPELEGRAPGSSGIDRAAEYVASAFAAAGLEPAGDEGFFQSVTIDPGPDGRSVETVNVLGALPGSRSDWKGQAVVVSAHYDHLGRGWPDVHRGDRGVIHPGADDNASGVAVLLELARALAEGEPPERTILFAAFTAEEAGRAGSRRYLEHQPDASIDVRAVVNLDTVGRLFDGAVSILGADTAAEWPHIFRGASYVTGVESRAVSGVAEASDQMSFIEAGIPGVQLFTGAHEDYHRPGDTADKIDGPGLGRVATLAKEAVVYLAGREEPMSVTMAQAGAREAAPTDGRRRVRLGTVPDFAFQGPGVRVESVGAGSPAARAGLEGGDVIVKIDGREVADLRTYSDVLKSLEAGQTIILELRRDGRDLSLEVTVEAR